MADLIQPGPSPVGSAGTVLASDRERDRLVDRLSAACADGRLDLADFSDRLDAALSARTLADIQVLEADLGPATPAPLAVPRSAGTSWFVGIMSSAVRKGRWALRPKSHALAVMGAIRVIVPEGIDVDVDGLAIMGAKTLKIGAASPLPGSPTIRVTAFAVMGEVSVVSKPPKGQSAAVGHPAERVVGQLSRHQQHLAWREQKRAIRRQQRWGGEEDD
ncbi:MAG TPA: DUF1707 domain-containing protein [Candidatus Dormibacteraeota bacterium]|nr:DUF1707 domain-containing protein [Candidatus Dormibacteraeota bacterium]